KGRGKGERTALYDSRVRRERAALDLLARLARRQERARPARRVDAQTARSRYARRVSARRLRTADRRQRLSLRLALVPVAHQGGGGRRTVRGVNRTRLLSLLLPRAWTELNGGRIWRRSISRRRWVSRLRFSSSRSPRASRWSPSMRSL